MTGAITLITAFEAPAADDQTFTAACQHARHQSAARPGWTSAIVHRALAPTTRFGYVTVVHTASADGATAAGIRHGSWPLLGRCHPGAYRAVSSEERLTSNDHPVTLINLFEVPATDDHAFVVGWEAARAHLSHQPGYLDTTLYQAVGPRARFRFVNIAHWASADAFTTAVTSPAFRASASLPYPAHPALYRPLTS